MTIIAIGAVFVALAAVAVLRLRSAEPTVRRSSHALNNDATAHDLPAVARRNWLVGVTGPVAGQWFFVGDRTMTMGRSAQNFVQVGVPDVSRRHCQLRAEDGSLLVLDMRSRTGVFVNGKRVRAGVLRDGDMLEIGGVSFQFKVEGTAPDATCLRKHANVETEALETRLSPPAAT